MQLHSSDVAIAALKSRACTRPSHGDCSRAHTAPARRQSERPGSGRCPPDVVAPPPRAAPRTSAPTAAGPPPRPRSRTAPPAAGGAPWSGGARTVGRCRRGRRSRVHSPVSAADVDGPHGAMRRLTVERAWLYQADRVTAAMRLRSAANTSGRCCRPPHLILHISVRRHGREREAAALAERVLRRDVQLAPLAAPHGCDRQVQPHLSEQRVCHGARC